MTPLELRLPCVAVGVNEARADQLALAVNGAGRRAGGGERRPNLRDFVAFDENVGDFRRDSIVGAVEEHGTALQEYAALRHCNYIEETRSKRYSM